MLGHKLVRQLCTQETVAMPRMASGLLSATPVSIQGGGLPPLPAVLMRKLWSHAWKRDASLFPTGQVSEREGGVGV